MIDYADAKRIAGMLAAVGEPTRMMILYRLAQGPHNVGQLAGMLGVPMVNMSHHLGVMRQAGLLDDEKDGRRVVYRFRPEIFTPGNGADPDVLATLSVGAYKLVIRRTGGPGAFRARPRRRLTARKRGPKVVAAAVGQLAE